MKVFAPVLAVALAVAVFAPLAKADPSDYGIESAEAATSTSQAGGHPDFTIALSLKREPNNELPAPTRDAIFELPPGLLANPSAVPVCSVERFVSTDVNNSGNATGCPQGSQVGITEVEVFNKGGSLRLTEPVYNIAPRFGEPARLGFFATSFPILVDARLRSDGDYGATAVAEGVSALVPLLSATTELWAVPADESHDSQRITPYEAIHNGGAPETPNGKRSSGLVPKPFMLNPTRCGVAQGVNIAATSYALPGLRSEIFAPLGANVGCGLLDFSPQMSVAPTTSHAETSSGLDIELDFPGDGFEHPNLPVESEQKRVEFTLPEGVTVNPSQAVGLGVCTEADYVREKFDSGPNEGCPEASKIGSITAKSPLLEETAEGGLFVAKPYANPFGTLIALYIVLKIPERGIVVKLPVKVEPDLRTGQLTSTVEGIPQLPVSSFRLHFREGARSPLVTPPRCGSYVSTANLSAWGGQLATIHPSFQITTGIDGGPCPSGTPPFIPGFTAGTLNNSARAYSPFDLRLTRRDGDQDLTRFSATLPPGVVAKLAGVSQCPDSAIETAKANTGKAEKVSPSCPASSEIGSVLAGAGVGEVLTYASGKLYLAGPYRGAPLSVVAIVPAVAGPFDIGTVVTKEALRLNPRTGVVTADGAQSDPLPHILAGIPLKVRDVRVETDRPDFTLNPTSCDPSQATATLWAGGNDVFSSADDSSLSLASRFQAANCSRLGFGPRLSLRLKGGAKRGGHPALRGVFRPRPGDANLAGLVLRLPHSAFLDQAHIRTICTRVQYAAEACPREAVYGHARAFTPLLDKPLEGPIYLRSSDHELPDFVADLHGLVDVEAVARIDSENGGIRTTFTDVPDAPLSEVVVLMQGGKKGLIVNSTDLCSNEHRAKARLTGHNAKRRTVHPLVQADCGLKHRVEHKRNH